MAETQGRGPYYDDARIEQAAKYAGENGGTDAAIQAAANKYLDGSRAAIQAIRDRIRGKAGRLFNK
jgi:hypothetical protein